MCRHSVITKPNRDIHGLQYLRLPGQQKFISMFSTAFDDHEFLRLIFLASIDTNIVKQGAYTLGHNNEVFRREAARTWATTEEKKCRSYHLPLFLANAANILLTNIEPS